ncbi:MAG TPA: hypothetical protein PLK61_04145 [Nitrosomonas sp.]|nr:hypothetical protein [Nitrosomonas sp.]
MINDVIEILDDIDCLFGRLEDCFESDVLERIGFYEVQHKLILLKDEVKYKELLS